MKLRPRSKWVVSTIPEAETICLVCDQKLIYSANERKPMAHNGACREAWRKRNANKTVRKFKRKTARKQQLSLVIL